MEEAIFIIILIGWVLSGFIGAGWLMVKGYTVDMLGCLGVLYGGALALIALFGPLMLFIAWALPSRTNPTQEGGVKKLLSPKARRKSLPKSRPRDGGPPRPIERPPASRRPRVSGDEASGRRAIPPRRPSSNRPKPPKKRS